MLPINIKVVRKIVQLIAVSLLIIPINWVTPPVWLGSYLSSQLFGVALTDPLAAGEIMLAGKIASWQIIISVIPLLIVTAIAGRVFCSWICPLNTMFEVGSYFAKPHNRTMANTMLPFGVLGFFFATAFMSGIPLFTIVSPIGILSRSITFGPGLEFLFVAILILISMFLVEKAWCRLFCPVGALYGLAGRFKIIHTAIDKNLCNNCGKCHDGCTMGAYVGSEKAINKLFCTNCGDCLSQCPRQAVHFSCKIAMKGGVKDEYYTSTEK